MKKLTREWIRKAEEDYAAAQKLATGKPPLRDGACFHCQQAAEKFLKALLQELGLPIPYTHDLIELLERILVKDATLKLPRPGLASLTHFAVDYRYPGKFASARQLQSALRLVGNVRQEIRMRLGILPKGRKR